MSAPSRSRTGTAGGLSDRTAIVISAGVAIALRLVLILSYPPLLSGDSGDYLDLAHRLASGNFHGWQARRTPLYSLLLLALHYSVTATWCVQALLGVGSTLLVYALIRILRGRPGYALAGALLYAVSLEVMALERVVLTEALTSFLVLASATLCALMIRRNQASARMVAGTSMLLALSSLTRPDSLAAEVFLALTTAGCLAFHRGQSDARRRRGRRFGLTSAALVAPALVGVIAWASFNAATTGIFTTSSVIGYNMIDHMGLYVTPTPGPDHTITAVYASAVRASAAGFPSYAATPEIERLTGLGPAQIGERYLRIALGLVAAHPLGYVGSSLRQWVLAWRQPNYAVGFRSGALGSITQVVWGIERPIQIMVCAFFLALVVISLLTWARSRRWPRYPATAVIAATALTGTFVAAFVGYTDPSRYAYPYLSLVFCVSLASAADTAGALRRARGLPRLLGRISSRNV